MSCWVGGLGKGCPGDRKACAKHGLVVSRACHIWAVVGICGEGGYRMAWGDWEAVSLERWLGPGGNMDLTLGAIDRVFQLRGWPNHPVALD